MAREIENQGIWLGPLDGLRGGIRKYVAWEAGLTLVLFASAWFWFDLLLDYGSYRLFSFDWVQSFPGWFRTGLLLLLTIGLFSLVITRALLRLNRDFSDESLALLLERKFPKLEDRLITAVQLTGDKLKRTGASPGLLAEVLKEASARMQGLPVNEVFDWQRLKKLAKQTLLVTLGGYMIALVAFYSGAGLPSPAGEERLGGFSAMNEVLLTWADRDLFLKDVIWPRTAFLQLVGFPDSGQVRVGRDAPPFPLKVRGIRFLVAGPPTNRAVEKFTSHLKAQATDPGIPGVRFARMPKEGWRPLTVFDLPDWLATPPDPAKLPAACKPVHPGEPLTLDEVDLFLQRPQSQVGMDGVALGEWTKALEELRQRGRSPISRRSFRFLAVPDTVIVRYWGASTSNLVTLQRGAENEFTTQLGDLRESVDFTAEAADYRTRANKILLVPPPMLTKLMAEELHPAYLYYRPLAGESAAALKGKKQKFEAQDMLQPGSDMSRLSLPEGGSAIVRAEVDTDIVTVRGVTKAGIVFAKVTPKLLDKRTFTFEVENLREETSFYLEYEDAEGVLGRRGVSFKPNADDPPTADLEPDSPRRAKDGLMVTPLARIPFRGHATDGHGLSEVRYAVQVKKMETEVMDVSTLFQISAIAQSVAMPGARWNATAFLGAVLPNKSQEKQVVETRYFPVSGFQKLLQNTPGEYSPLANILQDLGKPLKLSQRRPVVRSFQVLPDTFDRASDEPSSDFPVWKLGLAVPTAANTHQPRYKMELWLEALDHDIETGPNLTASKDRFLFILVGEQELLAEIGREEEKLKLALELVKGQLLESEARLALSSLDLAQGSIKAEQLGPMVARCEELNRTLETRLTSTVEVQEAYSRILKELKLNQVDSERIKRVQETIFEPLRLITAVEFPATGREVTRFQEALENNALALAPRVQAAASALQTTRGQYRKLIQAIEEVLAAMGTLTDINKLVAILRGIEDEERKQFDLIQKIHEELVKKTLEDALNPKK